MRILHYATRLIRIPAKVYFAIKTPSVCLGSRTNRERRSAIAPFIAIFIVIAILITLGLVATLFVSVPSPPVTAAVTPQIYAPNSAVGISNEVANFTVVISNALPKSEAGFIIVSSGGHVYQNSSFVVDSNSARQVFLTLVLGPPGIWQVDAYVNGALIPKPYTFDVEINVDQAQLKVDQFGVDQQGLNVSYASAAFAGLAVAIAALAYLRPRKVGGSAEGAGLDAMRRFLSRVRDHLSKLEESLKSPPTQDSEAQTVLHLKKIRILVQKAKLNGVGDNIEKATPDIWMGLNSLPSLIAMEGGGDAKGAEPDSLVSARNQIKALLSQVNSWLQEYS
jgi:hypothetical protein